jgi:small-conductance mechanosensitive channel
MRETSGGKMLNRLFYRGILTAVVLCTLGGNGRVLAQDQKNRGKISIPSSELEKTIRLLESPEESQKLAEQLKILLQAQKKATPPSKPGAKGPEKIAFNLFEMYESVTNQIVSALEELFLTFQEIPVNLQRLKTDITKRENFHKVVTIGVKLLGVLLLAFISWLVLRRFSRKMEAKLRREPPFTRFQKVERILASTLFRVYPWVALYILIYFIFLFFPIHHKIQSILLGWLCALILYLASKNFFYFLFSPERRETRVFPLDDDTSQYIFIWCRRVLLFILWMYFLIIPASVLRQPAIANFLHGFLKAGVLVLAAVILAQQKKTVEKAFRWPLKGGDPPWKANLKKILNYAGGKAYLAVILYLGVLTALATFGATETYVYLLYSTGRSIVVFLLAAGAWFLWTILFKRLFQVSNSLRETNPQLVEQVNRYMNYLEKGGYWIIALAAFLAILDAWGLDVYGFIHSNIIIAKALIRIPLIILMAFILIQFAYFLIHRLENQAKVRMVASGTVAPLEVEKRVSTLGRIFRRGIAVIVITFATMMVLSEIGFDITPVLAGAGVVGLAVGFGAQNLVRDVISGLFFIFENRIRVGDVAVLNGTGGLVEQVNLRTTVLRALDGTIHVFPNGAINTLSNMTYQFSYYVFDVGVAYKEDTDRVIAVLKELSAAIMKEEEYKSAILEPLEILGVDKFADSAVIIKARIKTLPIKQWFVGREMNRRIKKRFDELGIEIPFPHQSLYFGEASKSIRVKLEGFQEQREEIKALIREALAESPRRGGEK